MYDFLRRSPFRLSLAALLLCGAALPLRAQQPAATTPGASSGTLTDPATKTPARAHGDAREFKAAIRDGQLECVLRMEKPLGEGLFTCVELFVDCDDKPKTGLDGYELRVRAAVGSRFQPSDAEPTNGTRKAIDHTRISKTVIEEDGRGGKRWMHHQIEASPPTVQGAELRFAFPMQLIRERGDRYNSKFSVRVSVSTSCSDQPIELQHACSDAGLPVVLDGKAEEWSGPMAVDAPGEMHPSTRCVDLTGLRLEHDDARLYACVDLAEAGFARWVEDGDVRGRPVVTFYVEPMFPRYQEPKRYLLQGGAASFGTAKSPWMAVMGERVVEASFPRQQGQSRFRVIVQSDVLLEDDFATALGLDAEGKS